MSTLNKVILIGNVGKDPEIRMTQGGTKIANLSIATSERRKDKASGDTTTTTEWHRLIAFSGTADVIDAFVQKGSKIYIEGRIQSRKWTDKDGAERIAYEILVDKLVMLDGKKDGHDDSGHVQKASAKPVQVTAEMPFDDEIPF
ncbi:single-stranded DNA-binding protein [Xanthobacter sp. VTT E-85241]|uniref:single-stranded DNA-binding protein n=1 Tax=Roseixanthobacter finlandensis TaxID=3119922 RepID=UPI00372C86DB